MPDKKPPIPSLGRAESISSARSQGPFWAALNRLWRDVEPRTQENYGKALDVAQTFLNPNAVSAPGMVPANIGMLAKSPRVKEIPELQAALEWAIKRYPRLSKLGKKSEFVDKVSSTSAPPMSFPAGVYDGSEDAAQIALIGPDGKYRPLPGILNTIAHELFGHARQYARGMRNTPRQRGYSPNEVATMRPDTVKFLQGMMDEQKIPYRLRPSEIEANAIGKLFSKKAIRALMQRPAPQATAPVPGAVPPIAKPPAKPDFTLRAPQGRQGSLF
jgi:hypothetical protein